MANSKQGIYVFKPMKGLTFWARLLMVVHIAGLIGWTTGMVLSMQSGEGGPVVEALALTGIVLFMVGVFIGGVVSLCWIYGAVRNAHALRPGTQMSSPGWAVGWFFVPFMCLVKPYEAMRDTWIASKGPIDGRYPKGANLLVIWWWAFLISNVLLRFGGDDTGGDGAIFYASTPTNWVMVVGMCVAVVGTGCFFILVGEINRNQLTANTRVADVF